MNFRIAPVSPPPPPPPPPPHRVHHPSATAQQPAAAPAAAPGKATKQKPRPAGPPKASAGPLPPLPDSPYKFDTGAERNLTLTITKGLKTPFSMVFPDANTILITERGGNLRMVRNGVLSPTPVPGLPPIQAAGLVGLMDMALHPNFAQNSLIYIWATAKPAARRRQSLPVSPSPAFAGTAPPLATGKISISQASPAAAAARASSSGRDGMVYMNVSAAGDPPNPEAR